MTDVDIDMEFEECPTPVVRRCQDCAREAIVLDDSVQPPASPNEAWALMSCRGTANQQLWRWCRVLGEMAMPSQGIRVSFRKPRRR